MAFFDKVKDTITTGIKNTVKGVAEKAFATPKAPSYTQPKKTAYQNITAQPVETKWYKGATPTASEFEAQIARIGKEDYEKGRYLYGQYQYALNDPTSPIYNPYVHKPTSQAASELSAMGFDVSDPNFIQNNAWLKGEYRLGTSGSPLAPSSSSTTNQNAAYWYNKYMDDEETTLKAEQEWAALQEEVGYWAGRKDRNLTDEEIFSKINWNNYPTLKRMDEAKGKGLSVGLTRPVGYSQDALNGVIYGKRNGVEGDPSRLAVRAAYDGSTGYQRNEEVASRLNPNSDMYNPYAVGSTIDDQALYFGVDSFDKDWVANNRQYMSSMDETERRMYNAVAKAEANTSAAETEHAALMAYIDEQIAEGETDPDEIIEKVYGDGWGFDMAENGKTLAKMDESLEPGGTPMAMTRAVPYSRNDVERYIQERCEAENQKKGMDAVVGGLQSFMEKFLTPKELTATEKIAADTMRLVKKAVPPTEPEVPEATSEVPEATSEVPAAKDVELGLLPYTRKNPAETNAPAVKVDEVINPATAMAQMPANPVNPPNPEAMRVTASVVVSHGTEDEKKALIRHVSIDSLKRTNQFVHNFKNEEAGIVLGSMADAFAGENYVQIARAKNAYNGGYAAKLEEEQKRQSELQTQVEYADYAYSPVTGGYNTEVLGLYSGMDEDQKEIVRNSAYNAGSVGWNMEAAAAEFEAAGIADAWAIAENIATVSGYYKSEYATKSFGDIYFGAEEIGENTSAEIDKMLAPNPFEGVEPLFLEEPDFVANADMEISDLNASIAENKKLAEQDEVYLRDINKEPTIERQYAISEKYGGGASNGLFANVKDEIDFAFDVMKYKAPARNEYQTYEEVRAYYEQSGIKDVESYVIQYGKNFMRDYEFAAPAIDRIISDIDSGKIKGVTQQEYQALVDERDRLEREKRSWDYYMLQHNEDFDEVVQRVKDENENYTYEFIKGDTRPMILQGALKGEYYRIDPNSNYLSEFAFMTQEERDTILYLYETQGEEAAWDYYSLLADGTYGVTEPRRQISEKETWERVAKESPVASTLFSILYSPAKVAGGLYVAGSGIFGYDIDQYEVWLNAGVNVSAARETVKQQITDAFGEGTAGAFIGNLFYDAAVSGADSLLMSALTPGISLGSAEATNWLTKFGLKAVETSITAAPMALGAAGDVAHEVLANGGTQEQALLMAGWAFVAETVSESVTVGNIRDAFNAGPQGAKSFLRQVALDSFEEGTGEMMSEFISTWSDDAIMQELSQRNMLKEQFEAQGMSPVEAQEAADKQIMKNIWYAGLTGALSGGMSTTLSYASGRVGSADAKKTNTGISYGKKDGGDTKNVPINERPWTKEQLSQKEQAETTQTNAQQTSEPVASAPVGGFSIVEGDGAKVAVLESTSGEDVNNQAKTEAVAAALVTSEEQMPSAIASAQEMNSEFGDEATRNFVVDVITKAGMNAQTAGAIVAASLSKGEAHQMLTSMVTGETEVTPETVNQLVETAEADAQNPEIQGEIMGNIQRSVINNAVIDAGNAGGFNSIASQQTAVQTANQKLEEAKSVLQNEKHRYQALGESLNDAVTQFNADPTNQQIEALVTQIAKDMEGQNKMVKQAEQTVTNARRSVRNANKQLELTKATTLDNLRKQETQRIAEEAAQVEQAKAEQNFNNAVSLYKPEQAFKTSGVSLDGGKTNAIGFVAYAPGTGLFLMDDGKIVKTKELQNGSYAQQLSEIDVTAPNDVVIPFDHVVEMTDFNTGELFFVVGITGQDKNGEMFGLTTNNTFVNMATLNAVNPDDGSYINGEVKGANLPIEEYSDYANKAVLVFDNKNNLEDWQDPAYHGKVKIAKRLRTNTKNFENWFNDPTGDLTDPSTGEPLVFYRGFGGFGNNMYIEHNSKPDSRGHSYNFYMSAKSTAESYAKTNKIVKLYDIVNWETAAQAMDDLGLELRVGAKNNAGEKGYQIYYKNGLAKLSNGWFAENQLDEFRKTYGGIPKTRGIFAGYISVKKPLVIEAHGSSYSSVNATVKDKDGNDYTATMKTRRWAQWAFDNGYDSVIFRNVKDNANGSGVAATEVVTSKGSMFKSIWNTGKLGKKNNNILYKKQGVSQSAQKAGSGEVDSFSLTGESVSDEMNAVLNTLKNGMLVSDKEIMATPEVKWAAKNMLQGVSLQHKEEGAYTDAEVKEILGEDRYKIELEIADELLNRGSAVIDKKGKASYTGIVDRNKRLDIIIGPPAAGKSSALADPISQRFHSRILDSDDVKSRLPEYEGGLNSTYLHEESRFVWLAMQDEAIALGENIVLPIVGHKKSSVENTIDEYKEMGYSVHLHYVELEGTKTLGRALNRYLKDGRYIPPDYISKVSDGRIKDVYEELKGDDRIDGYSYWNNDVEWGQRPKLYEATEDAVGDLDGRGTYGYMGVQKKTDSGSESAFESKSDELPGDRKVNKQYSIGSTQQIAQGASSVNGTPKHSPQAIAKNMAKELGIGDYIGTRKMNNVPKDVMGYYETRAKYIAVRNKQAGNYAVTMHEIGHAIADKIGMTGTPQMVANLDPAFAASYKPAELPGEAFGEFVAYYMASEQAARNFAGDNFVDAFERALVQNGLDKAVNDNAKQLRMWINADTIDKIGAVIHARDEGKKSPLKEQFRKLLAGTIDSSSAAEAVAHEIRKQSGNKEIPLGEDIRTQALLNNTAHERAFNIVSKNLTNANWEVVGDSLSTVLEKSGITAKNMQLFERYMLALHSLDRDAQGKPVFDEHITTQERIEFIEQVQRDHPEIAKAEEAFQKWRTDFLTEFLVKTGRITQEELDTFNTMYPHYVPTQRVKGDFMSRAKEHGGSKKYKVRAATGSTEDIWSPIDTFVMMVDSIVADTSANNMALAWDNAAQKYNLGEFGRLVTPDVRKLEVDTKPLQAQVEEKLSGEVSDDVLQDVLDTIGTKQSQYISAYNDNKPGTLLVYHPDGRVSMYEMRDVELYKLLASVNDNTKNPVFEYIGKLVRGMTALTTGSNPVFAIRNFMRDFQNSVNYGSWATSYVDGSAKWLRAAWDVFRENGDFQKYQAIGGGGWTRIEAGSKKGASQYRAALFKGYNTSNVGRTAKFAGQKLWNTITFARLNEVIEQTSRYAEFKYGKNDTSTAEGAQKAFVASQDVTVDFHRSGNSNLAKVLKQTIPFFSASAQGVYRTGRMFSKGERSRLPQRFMKTVINTALMSILSNGILLKNLDEDEKKEYAMMSDEMKSQHLYFPNPNTKVFGLQPLVRIPLAQDPLTYAIHGVVTNAMWSGSTDDLVISGEAIATTMLDSMNPFGSGTIFEPIISIGKNENYYGGTIVPSNLAGLNVETLQYTEETPDLFVAAGRFFGMCPLKVQYLAEQYTGFFGQIAIPALSKDKNTGELGGLPAVIKAAQKRFTSDPLVSNDVVSSFYDGFETIEGVKQAAEKGKPLNSLRRGLTEEEATAAYTEAKELVSADGILGKTKKEISDLYKEIDEINANPTLSEEKKYVLTSDIRREIVEKSLYAQEAIGAYREKYVTGGNLLTMRFEEGVYAHVPTAYETLPDVFKADENESYMQAAKSVWESTGDDNALPHPLEEFEKKNAEGKKIKYHPKETGHWEEYEKVYHKYYKDYCNTNRKKLASDDEEVRLQVLKDAHSKAHSKAKEWYFDQPGVLE